MICPECKSLIDVGSSCRRCNALAKVRQSFGIDAASESRRHSVFHQITSNNTKMLFVVLAFSVFTYLYMYGYLTLPARKTAAGVIVEGEPLQTELTSSAPWKHKGFNIQPLARYKITGRVLELGFFYFTANANISPVDLTLGWGPMSDQAVLDQIAFMHAPRMVFVSCRDACPVAYELINRSFSNNHIIPANNEVRSVVMSAVKGDIITLEGYLVSADGWGSSLSRTDTGNGACEVIWVEKAELNSK